MYVHWMEYWHDIHSFNLVLPSGVFLMAMTMYVKLCFLLLE